jgi:hypothetical protein
MNHSVQRSRVAPRKQPPFWEAALAIRPHSPLTESMLNVLAQTPRESQRYLLLDRLCNLDWLSLCPSILCTARCREYALAPGVDRVMNNIMAHYYESLRLCRYSRDISTSQPEFSGADGFITPVPMLRPARAGRSPVRCNVAAMFKPPFIS